MRLGVAAALVDGVLVSGRRRRSPTASIDGRRAAAAPGSGIAAPGLRRPAGQRLRGRGPDGHRPRRVRARRGGAAGDGHDGVPADVRDRAGGGAARGAAGDAARRASARASSARTSKGRSCRRGGPACTTRAGCSAPDLALLRRLLDAAPVSQVTLAPELPGAFELIDELVARGVTVSAGHTDATAAEAHLAFDRGVRTVTHLFNAMRHSTARDPSIAMSALARPDVIVQVIVDLHHVAPDTVLVAWHAASVALRAGHRRRAGGGDGRRRVRARRAQGRTPPTASCAARRASWRARR